MIKRRFVRVAEILRCYLGIKDPEEIQSHLLWNENEYGPLRSNKEIEHAAACLKTLGLPVGHDWPKAWDRHKIFSHIIRHISLNSPILDAGCGRLGGHLLFYLKKYGYKELFGCDIVSYNVSLGSIKLSRQDITSTNFPDNKFACISSISVVEHGVDILSFFNEMNRILKPGGALLLSTDYWCEPVDTKGIYPYAGKHQMKVFTPLDIQELYKVANKAGFLSLGKTSLDCGEPVVEWEGRKFTFILCGWIKASS